MGISDMCTHVCCTGTDICTGAESNLGCERLCMNAGYRDGSDMRCDVLPLAALPAHTKLFMMARANVIRGSAP